MAKTMTRQVNDNRKWLRAKVAERGLTEKLLPLARAIAWDTLYCRAYSDGHNNRGLRGRRLAHFARAYADICEEVDTVAPELEMTLDAFWLQWGNDGAFEGTSTEHWHFA
jgi:hypothetical protein